VQSVESNERGGPIANMIVGLGKNLGLDVIAEGVETEGQLDYLRRQGCDVAQGYYYARPEAPEDLTLWIASHQRVSETNVRFMPKASRDDETGT
jgi:EAL domain-containing protein (putative c-di-GMP-specific phosphodiesterase class I)